MDKKLSGSWREDADRVANAKEWPTFLSLKQAFAPKARSECSRQWHSVCSMSGVASSGDGRCGWLVKMNGSATRHDEEGEDGSRFDRSRERTR